MAEITATLNVTSDLQDYGHPINNTIHMTKAYTQV